MQVTVHIPDQLAARLETSGTTPEHYIESLIAEDTKRSPATPIQGKRKIDVRAFFESMDRLSRNVPYLPNEAFTREKIYQEHD